MNPTVKTTCPYCGVGCGVLATRRRDGSVEVAGDPRHPANYGKLCVKGAALGETLGPENRLLYPTVHGERASWDAALGFVAQRFQDIIQQHGPESVALYVSGQLLTEDYYVANKLMKGFIGTANIDTNSRLCMSSAVAGHKRAFGGDLVPVCYEDLELADLVILVGSNTAWCHPIIFQRIAKAKQARPEMKVVVIDPRRTATCELADLHLPVKSGTDVWLFNGLLSFLHQHGIEDRAFVDSHTRGADEAIKAAANGAATIADVARACRLSSESVGEFFRLFARTPRTVTAFSQGVNQSSSGTDKVNSIINCHLLTGRIGKPGMGPFSITGQPNAMGGREVGGLANLLAAHMDLQNPGHRAIVQDFWQSPRIASAPGLKAVELFEAIHDGQVRAVWIMATNPVVSLPNADRVREALARCELVVVSDCIATTDTAAHAHVMFPATGWGEKDGTVTNSERRISRQRAFAPAAGEARPDWWIISQIAQRMGWKQAFDYSSPAQVFDEHARLSGAHNQGSRGFDISGLAGMTVAEYDALLPVHWPVGREQPQGTPRLFEDHAFMHADRRACLIPTPPCPPANMPDEEYPLVMNTGRIRDQWHTMTRTGLSPKLSGHLPEPYVEIHPYDAMLNGVQDGSLVRVASRWGALVARLKTSGDLPRRSVFVPIHWNDQFASDARVGGLVNPVVDPISGEPEFKHTPVRIEPFLVDWHGFVLTRQPLMTEPATWWTRIQGQRFLRYELGGREKIPDFSIWARQLLGAEFDEADWLEYSDATAGIYRAAFVVDDRIEACVFLSPRPDLPSRAWLSGLFTKPRLEELDRIGLLVGQPTNPQADTGAVVCSCFGVGRNVILDAIRAKNLRDFHQVGACLKAGTNCGSCVPEIKSLLASAHSEAA
jgi:assimilatory nitrate reductase catalytic subunit